MDSGSGEFWKVKWLIMDRLELLYVFFWGALALTLIIANANAKTVQGNVGVDIIGIETWCFTNMGAPECLNIIEPDAGDITYDSSGEGTVNAP